MSYQVFHYLMTALYTFCALMVVARFVMYRDTERSMSPVYFWGGALFLSLALTDLTSALFFGTGIHVWQTLLFLGLTVVLAILSVRKRMRPVVAVEALEVS